MNNLGAISLDHIEKYKESYNNNTVSKVMTKAVSKTSIEDVCYDLDHVKKMNFKFSLEIPTLPATNQKSSARCWMFASLNILREKVAKKLNLGQFELSQNFITFYDHLEKANSFLEGIIETSDRDIEDRLVNWLFTSAVSDGGWWDMFVGLCSKYGVVPKEAMPETFQSSNTASMNRILNAQLRQDAILIRRELEDGTDIAKVRKLKDEMLEQIFNILAICLGNPPETFDFEYVDKENNYHADRGLTPREFYDKYIGEDIEEIVSVGHAPSPSKQLNQTYEISYAGAAVEKRPVRFLNITMEEMKDMIIRQLKDGEIVWFTCDCGRYIHRQEGIWDTGLYDYITPFGLDLHMTKGEMLDTRQSVPNHAMTITGVNFVDGKPDKWKIQNSWGDDKGDKGYFIISDEWFDQYVYLACVNKKYFSEEQKQDWEKEAIVLPPWDQLA